METLHQDVASQPAQDPNVADEAWVDGLAKALNSEGLVLPVLPQVATQVIALTSDPNSQTGQISSLIHSDPTLAAQVLRIVNSPMFRGAANIISLQQAVTRLGLRQLGEVVVAASLRDGMFEAKGHESTATFLRMHALASGLFAKEVARTLRKNVENAFLCGLLHQIGKSAVLSLIAEFDRKQGRFTTPQARDAALNRLYVDAGMRIADFWDLPESVREAIAHHQNYTLCAPPLGPMVARLGGAFADWLFDSANEDSPPQDRAFVDLNLYPDQITALMDKAEAVRQSVEVLL